MLRWACMLCESEESGLVRVLEEERKKNEIRRELKVLKKYVGAFYARQTRVVMSSLWEGATKLSLAGARG